MLPKGLRQDGIARVFLANGAKSQPPGWSQHVNFSLTMVNQTDEKCTFELGMTTHTFKASPASALAAWNNEGLTPTVPDDIRSTTPSMGYIVNDTLVIQCDIHRRQCAYRRRSTATDAHTAPQRETRIVDADTAAAAAIAAAFPGPGALPAIAGRWTSPAALPAMYPTGAGGLLHLPRGAQLNY